MTARTGAAQPAKPERALHRLVEPGPHISDVGERRAAQLVAVVSLALMTLTVLAMIMMLVFGASFFWSRLPVVAVLLGTLAASYVLNRTRYHTLAGVLLCVGPIWSNMAVGLAAPDDPLWYAFLPAGTLLASVLLTFRSACLVSMLGVAATAAVLSVRYTELGRERSLLIASFVVMFSAIVLATARFRAWVERGRREELTHLERQLAATQRMEAVGRLAASVAHDFNNFLTVIEGNTQLARRRPEGTYFDETLQAVDRAGALTAQLLTFARQKPTRPVPLRVDELVQGLSPILTRLVGTQVTLALDLHSSWQVSADPVALEQVLVNLIANARDAMPEGGTVRVVTADEASVVAPGLAVGDYVSLTVSDEGTGMDAATLERAFEPFFTTKPEGKGTGLGLATVRGIVLQAGGQVTAHSELGKGTTVHVRLPRRSVQQAGSAVGVLSRAPIVTPSER